MMSIYSSSFLLVSQKKKFFFIRFLYNLSFLMITLGKIVITATKVI